MTSNSLELPNIHGCPFSQLFGTPPHTSTGPREELEEAIRTAAARIELIQPHYHPIYGIDDLAQKSYRRELLLRNVDFVAAHFSDVPRKSQIRVLDVGCNLGFVAMKLAEAIPNVVGIDLMEEHLKICRDLAAFTGSSARFFKSDIVELLTTSNTEFNNVDAILLLNVVHQIIFRHGLPKTQVLLAKLANSVDVMFIELAKREDYKSHKKDHLLPWEPDEVFSLCSNSEISLLAAEPRPLYQVRRKRLRIGSIEIEPTSIRFSENSHTAISRKYYVGSDTFLKLYRLNRHHGPRAFHNEVQSLLKLTGAGICPEILDWTATS